jgi:hypothetical protein
MWLPSLIATKFQLGEKLLSLLFLKKTKKKEKEARERERGKI